MHLLRWAKSYGFQSEPRQCPSRLAKLDSVIVEDLYLNETACFWERPDSPEGDPVKPEDIQTELARLKTTERRIRACGFMRASCVKAAFTWLSGAGKRTKATWAFIPATVGFDPIIFICCTIAPPATKTATRLTPIKKLSGGTPRLICGRATTAPTLEA